MFDQINQQPQPLENGGSKPFLGLAGRFSVQSVCVSTHKTLNVIDFLDSGTSSKHGYQVRLKLVENDLRQKNKTSEFEILRVYAKLFPM
jgi:hypothetical protein